MKRLLTFLLLVLLAQAVWAQNSTKLSYQAVVRNANNELVANVPVTVEVSILDATSGTTWYTETHSVTTNANGLITLMIGEGTPVSGNLKDVAWDNASIKTSIGAGSENIDNTTAVNAVPYALHADSARTVNREVLNEQIHEITDDAIGNLTQRITNTNVKVDNLDQKLTDTLDYYATQKALNDTAAAIRAGMNNIVTDETDPTVPDWAKAAEKPAYDYSEIQNTPNLDGYLTSETDPNVPEWAKESTKPAYDYSEIVNTPSLDGYLTSETDPTVPDWAKAAEKPSYSYDEITGTPDLSGYLTAETDPTVNNATITVKQGENTLGTFTTNAGEDVTIAIPEAAAQVNADWGETDENAASFIKNKPTDLSAFSNTPGYVTAFEVQEAANIPTKVSAFQNDAHYVNKDVDSLTYYAKLTDIPAQVNADWEATEGAAQILHKPEIPVVNDGQLTIKQGETTLGTFTANAAEGKTIEIPEVDLSDYAKTEDIPDVSGFLTEHQDLSEYAKLTDIPDVSGFLTEHQDLSEYAKLTDIPDVSGFLTEHQDLSEYAKLTDIPDVSGFLTTETDPTVNNSTITVKQGETTLGTFTTNAGEDVTIAIPEAPAQVQADWNATEGAAVILNKPTDLGDFTNTPGYVTAVDVAEAAGVPTKVSQLENDANYITAADIPAETDPTVKNTTITFTQGETTLGSFTTNTATETTINIPAVTIPAETDPTVPEWAKAETKPAYSYDEISGTPDLSGYLTEHQDLSEYAKLADIPTVPTKVSELTNDVPFLTEHQDLSDYAKTEDIPDVSGFLTTETDPNVPAWAKETNKPAYDYSEIANTPDLTGYLTTETDPTVKDATITFTQGESTLGTFTTNAGTDVTIAIPEVTIPAETDPTVPDWAKEANKPAYDYSEIANTPDLTGYLTSENDPNVPAWAKEANKPAYDYSEIANTPDLSGYLTSENDPNVPAWAKEANKPAYDYSEIANTPDLSGYLTTETDPTVKDATITFTQGETTLGTFTTNAGTDVTIAIPEAPEAPAQVQANWNETDESSAAFIKNKPTIPEVTEYNEACLSTTFCELVNTVNKLLSTVDSLKDVIAGLNNNATPNVTTNTEVTFDHGNVTVGGNVTSAGFGELTERGICYGTTENPTIEGTKMAAAAASTGAFTCTLTGLTTDTKYYARAYATNAAGTTYGDNVEFTIYEDPQLSMVEVTVSATGTISATGNLAQEGLSAITELGICWGTEEEIDPDNDGHANATAIALGDYTLTLTGDFAAGTYYVKAYAKTGEGVFTSEDYKTFTITAPVVATGAATLVSGQMQLNGTLTTNSTPAATEIGVCWGTTAEPDVDGDHQAASAVAEGEYSVTATNLTAGTYNARAYATYAFGTVYGEAVEFTISAPVVTTGADPEVDNEGQKVTVSGNVTDAGSAEVTKRGICYGTTAEPDTTNKVAATAGTGEFSATLTDLTAGVTYYARAYAVNAFGIAYGEDVTFQLEVLTDEPVVTTGTATYNTATGNIAAAGEVVSAGLGGEVTERGICYSTSANPTVDDSKVAAESAGTGEFNVTLTGLTLNTIYHLRAYATNAAGTSYGDEITVGAAYACGDKIKDIDGNEYATVKIGKQCWMQENMRVKRFIHPTTGDTTNMQVWNTTHRTSSNVLKPEHYCYAEVTENTITSMGTEVLYCWGTATLQTANHLSESGKIQGICPTGWHVPSPTEYLTLATAIDSNFTNAEFIKYTSGTTNISNDQLAIRLASAPVKEGDWRAYQNGGVTHGEVATSGYRENSPGYATHNEGTWNWNTSNFNAKPCGYIKKDGSASTAQGDWWQNGTLNLITNYGSNTSGYTVKIACYHSGIQRFYSSGEGYTGYSLRCVNDNTFMEGDDNNMPAEVYAPTVTTGTATLAGNEVTVTGNVTDKGGSDVTACGIYYGTTASPATTKVDATPGEGEFSCTLPTGLQGGVTYYARAFATNAQGTRYGEDVTFTLPLAEVTTGTASMDGMNMVVNGEVTDEGASTVTSRGICYGTSANPTTQVAAAEGGVGEFTVSISGLNNNTLYYLRAYATNSEGTVYGEDIQFTCTMPVPTVTTGEVTISDGDAIVAGSITDNGGSEIQERGICWGTSENPTIGDNKIPYESTDDEFFVAISGLSKDVKYHARAYATNESGTGYGEDVEVLIPFVCGTDKLVDLDNNEYPTTQIGSQCWMAENLRVKSYMVNGTKTTLNSSMSTSTSTPYYVEINASDISVSNVFPKSSEVFYSWYSATLGATPTNNNKNFTVQGLCPDGWHIPSYNEILNLARTIDPSYSEAKLTNGQWTSYKYSNNAHSEDSLLNIQLADPDATWVWYPATANKCNNQTYGVGSTTPTAYDYSGNGNYICPAHAQCTTCTPAAPATGYPWNKRNFNAWPVGYIQQCDATVDEAPSRWTANGTLNFWTSFCYSGSNRMYVAKVAASRSGLSCGSSNNGEYNSRYSVRCLKD